jgi:hypothetical protein
MAPAAILSYPRGFKIDGLLVPAMSACFTACIYPRRYDQRSNHHRE